MDALLIKIQQDPILLKQYLVNMIGYEDDEKAMKVYKKLDMVDINAGKIKMYHCFSKYLLREDYTKCVNT